MPMPDECMHLLIVTLFDILKLYTDACNSKAFLLFYNYFPHIIYFIKVTQINLINYRMCIEI